jgi:hypothetical protein
MGTYYLHSFTSVLQHMIITCSVLDWKSTPIPRNRRKERRLGHLRRSGIARRNWEDTLWPWLVREIVVSKTGLASSPSICGTYIHCSSVGSFGTARLGDEDFFIPGLCLAIDFFRFSLLLRNCLSALRGFLFPQARWKSIYYHSWVMGIARIATTTLDAVQKVIFLSSDVR